MFTIVNATAQKKLVVATTSRSQKSLIVRLWDKYAIRAEIHRRGATLTGIATAAGLDPSACRTALRRRFPAGEEAVATFLGIPASELWPSRYSNSGISNARRTRRASQKSMAATDIGAAE